MGERKVFKDYEEGDVASAYEHAQPCCWQDLVNFLERQGLDSWFIAPGESAHMLADLKQAVKDNVPFSYHSETAFRVMRSHRNPELVRQEEHRWLQKTAYAGKSNNGATRGD